MVRRLIEVAVLSAVLGASGCLVRTYPIPPPGASAAEADCAPDQCPGGGIIVTVTGTSDPMALIVVEDTSRQFADGTAYIAAAYATGPTSAEDGGSGSDGGGANGTYSVTLGPSPDPSGGMVVAQHGDMLQVTQFVTQSDGNRQESMPFILTVP